MAERPPAADLRGVHASDDSCKASMKRPAEACTVDFRFSPSYVAVGSMVEFESFACLLSERRPKMFETLDFIPSIVPK